MVATVLVVSSNEATIDPRWSPIGYTTVSAVWSTTATAVPPNPYRLLYPLVAPVSRSCSTMPAMYRVESAPWARHTLASARPAHSLWLGPFQF